MVQHDDDGNDHHYSRGREGAIQQSTFRPTEHTVLLGGGKNLRQSPGNRRLIELVRQHLPDYRRARHHKARKSQIVRAIVGIVRRQPGGVFCRVRSRPDGSLRYTRVDQAVAREKVGYVFRDLLGTEYRSSSRWKVARRNQELFGGGGSTMHYQEHRPPPIALVPLDSSPAWIPPPPPKSASEACRPGHGWCEPLPWGSDPLAATIEPL